MLRHLAEREAYSESRPKTERFSCGNIRLWDLPLSLKRSDRSLKRSEGMGFLATQHLEEGSYHSPYTIYMVWNWVFGDLGPLSPKRFGCEYLG